MVAILMAMLIKEDARVVLACVAATARTARACLGVLRIEVKQCVSGIQRQPSASPSIPTG